MRSRPSVTAVLTQEADQFIQLLLSVAVLRREKQGLVRGPVRPEVILTNANQELIPYVGGKCETFEKCMLLDCTKSTAFGFSILKQRP